MLNKFSHPIDSWYFSAAAGEIQRSRPEDSDLFEEINVEVKFFSLLALHGSSLVPIIDCGALVSLFLSRMKIPPRRDISLR